MGFPSGSAVENPPAMQEIQRSGFDPWVRKIPLEEGTATHSRKKKKKMFSQYQGDSSKPRESAHVN